MRSGSASVVSEIRGAVAGFARTAYGIEIVDVELLHLTLPEQNREHVFERMKAERGKMAKEFRTAGELQARKIIAEADRERSHIEAEAYEQAQRLRAEGDAEASRIYAAAFGQNPRSTSSCAPCRPTRSSSTRTRRCFCRPTPRCCACCARNCAREPGAGASAPPVTAKRKTAESARTLSRGRHGKPGAGSAPAMDVSLRTGAGTAMTEPRTSTRQRRMRCGPPQLRGACRATPLLDRPARGRTAAGLSGHRLLRRQCRRARGGAPLRRHRRARRARHALPPALAGGSRRRAQDHQRDEDRRRLRAARERRAGR